MTAKVGIVEVLANQILQGVGSGERPFICLQKLVQQQGSGPVLLVHVLISLGLAGGKAIAAVGAAQGFSSALTPDEVDSFLLEAIQTTDLAMSSKHPSKVQENTP
ncbi:hypothetical protein [Deinococcus fonticola]|uniref:hypothetical protein n=1 Tax=Deinococcus fonticola TaxID=2528713 RepID=UPI001074BE16|nr:hypothetical protein [Deinococcus fonticola]